MINIAIPNNLLVSTKIQYTLRELSRRSGISIRTSFTVSGADFAYSLDLSSPSSATALPCQLWLWTATLDLTDLELLFQRFDAQDKDLDIIAFSFIILNLLDQTSVGESNSDLCGNFSVNSLPDFRKNYLTTPIVDILAARFANLLNKSCSPFKWPNDRKYAISLTHDCDCMSTSNFRELSYNLLKFLVRRHRHYLDLFADGVLNIFKDNALNSFENWVNFSVSENLSFPQTFYVPSLIKAKRHINDCRSIASNTSLDFRSLSSVHGPHIEFGLHASIYSHMSQDEFVFSKKYLENMTDIPIFGLRHHYWSINWRKPYLTYRKHINAGFKYDATMAWKDSIGFRSGTAFPYNPFDPVRNKPLDIYILPTACMDGHIVSYPSAFENIYNSTNFADKLVKETSLMGGMLILDWHLESINSHMTPHVYTVKTLIAILEVLLRQDEYWLATPWDIVSYFHLKTKDLYYHSND